MTIGYIKTNFITNIMYIISSVCNDKNTCLCLIKFILKLKWQTKNKIKTITHLSKIVLADLVKALFHLNIIIIIINKLFVGKSQINISPLFLVFLVSYVKYKEYYSD